MLNYFLSCVVFLFTNGLRTQVSFYLQTISADANCRLHLMQVETPNPFYI